MAEGGTQTSETVQVLVLTTASHEGSSVSALSSSPFPPMYPAVSNPSAKEFLPDTNVNIMKLTLLHSKPEVYLSALNMGKRELRDR